MTGFWEVQNDRLVNPCPRQRNAMADRAYLHYGTAFSRFSNYVLPTRTLLLPAQARSTTAAAAGTVLPFPAESQVLRFVQLSPPTFVF